MTNTTTVVTAIVAFILGAAVALGLDHFAFHTKDQRDAMSTIGGFEGWRLSCPPRTDKTANCVMTQALARRGSGAILAELNIAPGKDKSDALTIVAPLGVFVLPGVTVSVGGTSKSASYKTCLPAGCVASLPIDQALAGAMAKNAALQVTVVAEGKPVPLNFSLKGFNEAMAARAVDVAARK